MAMHVIGTVPRSASRYHIGVIAIARFRYWPEAVVRLQWM
jgi:hypothetical protein